MSYRSDNDDSHNPWYSGPRPKETTIEDDLRAENARLKAELGGNGHTYKSKLEATELELYAMVARCAELRGLHEGQIDINLNLKADLEALKAELEALRPKPVVEVRYYRQQELVYGTLSKQEDSKIVVTFTDGKLTAATIIGDDNGKV